MAKRQIRRSISVCRAEYEASKLEADRLGLPLAKFTEAALREFRARALSPARQAPVGTTLDDGTTVVSNGPSDPHVGTVTLAPPVIGG